MYGRGNGDQSERRPRYPDSRYSGPRRRDSDRERPQQRQYASVYRHRYEREDRRDFVRGDRREYGREDRRDYGRRPVRSHGRQQTKIPSKDEMDAILLKYMNGEIV